MASMVSCKCKLSVLVQLLYSIATISLFCMWLRGDYVQYQSSHINKSIKVEISYDLNCAYPSHKPKHINMSLHKLQDISVTV